MSRNEVEFELVGSRNGPSTEPSDGRPETQGPDPMDVLDHSPDAGASGSVRNADVRAFDAGSFPLAGPIIESSTRELTGLCSNCDTRLRIRAKGPGTVKVRCPICGHTRRIEI